MVRIIVLVALLVIGVQLPLATADTPQVRIMPLGDSLTSGYSVPTYLSGYRDRLYSLLGNAGYNVNFVGTQTDTQNLALPDPNHEGHGGYRIDQIDAGIGGWLDAVEDPDVILLIIGTNDFYQNYNWAGASGRLDSLVTKIAALRPFAKILLGNLPLQTTYQNPGQDAAQSAYNASIPGIVSNQAAFGRQVYFVDIHGSFSTSAYLSTDGVHPNPDGYDKMADTWLPAIAGAISTQGTSNPPVIVRTGALVDLTHVPVVFSKPVADDAVNLANFSVSGGLTVSNAVLDPATKRTITLTTSPQTPGLVYSLSVSGVRDRTARQTQIAPGSMVNFYPNVIINGSFENDYAGWTHTGNQEVTSTLPYFATDGAKIVAFNGYQLAPNGVLSQSFATTIGRAYHLTFDLGALGYVTTEQQALVKVQGATTLVSSLISVNAPGGNGTRWVPQAYDFTANSTTTTLTFSDVSPTTDSIDLVLDHVWLGASVIPTLAVTSSPTAGANMTITPTDTNGNGNGNTGLIRSYNAGTVVTVTAPATVAGAGFLKWQRNGVDLPGSTPAITVTLNASLSLNAIYGVNHAPLAATDAYSTSTNTALAVTAAGVLTNDSDSDANPLTAVPNAAPVHGTLTLNTNGSFVYTPAAGYQGSDSFTYHINDGVADSNVVTVALNVNAGPTQLIANGSFEASPNFASWTKSGNLEVLSSSPYTATDGTKLVVFNRNKTPSGTLSQSFATVAGQTYQLSFDMGVYSTITDSQSLQVTVAGSSNLLSQTIAMFGPGGGNTNWLPKNFTFAANSATTTLTFNDVSTTTTNIDLVLDNVRVNKAYTLAVASAPVSGLAAALSPADLNTNASGIANFTRSYRDGTLVNLSVPVLSGSLRFLKWQKNGVDFSTNPGTSVTMNSAMTLTAVYGNNAAPLALAQSVNLDEDTPTPIMLSGSDVDGDILTFAVTTGPSHGSLSGTAPNLTYTPVSNYNGPDSFSFKVNDGTVDSAPATVTIAVTAVVDNFAEWLAGFGMTGNPADDPDHDSITNAVEYLIGGNPKDHSDVGLLPSISRTTEDYLRFTYRRTHWAKADPAATVTVKWSEGLAGPWTTANGAHGEVIVEVNNGAANGVDLVNVYIPSPPSGRLFARLGVEIDTP